LRSSSVAALLACLLVLAGSAVAGEEPDYSGRSLVEVLRALQAQGLQVIFSSDLVRPEMAVTDEPDADSLRALLEEILAPHGLKVVAGPGNTLLVVKAPARPAAGVITGSVHSQSTGLPLPGALVTILETGAEATADQVGMFRIPEVTAGTYTISARASGFHPRQSDPLPLAAGASIMVAIELAPQASFLKEIVVTPSYLGLLRETPEPRQFLSRREVDRTPHLADDLYRAIGRLPGMARSDFSARMSIRGGADNEVLVLLDGLELHEPYHFRDMLAVFSAIDSEAVAGVDILSGGFTAEYGNRMSGVLDISSVSPGAETEAAVGVSFINARALGEGSFDDGRGQWLLSLRRGYLDIILNWTQAMNDDSDRSEEFGPRYWDLLGKVQYQVSQRTNLSANILLADDKAYFYDDDPEELEGKYRSTYTWFNLKTEWRPKLFSQTVLSNGQISRDRYGLIPAVDTISDERAYRFLGFNQEWRLETGQHYVKWGAEVRNESASFDYFASGAESDPWLLPQQTDPRQARVDIKRVTLGAYAADRFKLAEPLILELGLRWDHQSEPGESQLSPRCNLVYSRGRGALRAAWGRYYQPQRLYELPVEDGITGLYPAQLAEHRLIGYEHQLGNGIQLRAEAYQKLISNPHPRFENLFERTTIHPELRYDRVQLTPSRAETRGIELLVKQDGGHNPSWWASYALARAEDEIDDVWVPRSWDQRHTFRFSITWLLKKGWTATVAGIYHSGWPTTSASGELVEHPDGFWYVDADLGQINGERMRSYYRLDFRAGRRLQVGNSSVSFFFELINVLNRHNYTNMDGFWFDHQPNGSIATTAEWDTWLPLTPSFGFSWRF
jgi:outer membrane receptor protein involved in Fe transport